MKPKYAAVYEALVQRIETMSPGDRLESETRLAEDFNVAPMTVRRALEMLSNEGRTVGRRGKGTFVADPSRSSRPDVLGDTGAHLVSATLERAGSDLSGCDVDSDAFVFRMVHTRTREESVVGVQTTTAVASAFDGLLGRDLSRPVGEILDGYGVPASGAQVVVAQAGEHEARILGVEEGRACLCVQQRWGEERLYAISVTLVRTDRYALRL